MAVFELFVDQFLAIDEGETNFPFAESVSDTLVITDFAKNYRTVERIGQTILFGQQTSPRRSVLNLSAGDFFEMHEQGAKGPDLQILTQFLHVGQEAKTIEFEALSQAMSLGQSANFLVAKNAVVSIEFEDAASCNLIRSATVSQTLFVGSGGTGYLLEEDTYSVTIPSLSGPNAPEC